MPYKNLEDKLECGRRFYRAHREQVIAQVAKRKKEKYGGTCVVCGEKTVGSSKNTPAPRFCAKHKKELWAEKKEQEQQ